MNDDLHPDAFDDELRRRFSAGAAADADPDAVLDAMRPRLHQARTRRRASIAGAVGAAAAVVIVLLFALGGGGGGDSSVKTPPASQGPVHTFPTAPATPTTAPAGGAPTADTVPDDHGTDTATGSTTPAAPDESTPAATGTPPDATTPTQPAPTDTTYTSAGGSIVVHFENGQVSLVSSSPASRYTAEVHDNGPTRVEVRFSNGQTEWRIRVDVANGVLQPAEITQSGG